MIIYTPVNLPKLEPDDWDVFWNIWNTHSNFALKTAINQIDSKSPLGSKNVWRGLDIFKKPIGNTSWTCPYVDISSTLPQMYKSILQLNIKSLYRVRLLQSLCDISSHTDDNKDCWNIRGYLHYTDTKSQWYFTKPSSKERTYARLPSNVHWFSYNDKHAWHGTDYDPTHKKILIQLYFFEPINEIIQSNINTYRDYTIDYS
jgi:hypothetical protein